MSNLCLPGNGRLTAARHWRYWLLALLGLFAAFAAADPLPPPPRIALIIDDMGNNKRHGAVALALPGALTYSFLPHTRYAAEQALQAHRLDKEVMLHLPMESLHGQRLGPGALTGDMQEQEIHTTLAEALAAVPNIAGVNNHMGSLVTSDSQAMGWLMQALSGYPGLYFIDSRTTDLSLAEREAERQGLASARRDVFLDHDRDPELIQARFERLLAIARRRGSAIGIAHPYPETLGLLAERLPQLAREGVELVPVSTLTEADPRRKPWRVYSSPLPPVVKSSKP